MACEAPDEKEAFAAAEEGRRCALLAGVGGDTVFGVRVGWEGGDAPEEGAAGGGGGRGEGLLFLEKADAIAPKKPLRGGGAAVSGPLRLGPEEEGGVAGGKGEEKEGCFPAGALT